MRETPVFSLGKMLKFRYCKQRVSVFILDGKPLALDRPFVAHGTQYPANWLRLATPAERAAIGITEGPDPRAYDRDWETVDPELTVFRQE